MDSPSGVAMKPVAMPPAVAASDARSPVPSSLIGRLKTMSARMSDSSSGGVLESASSGVFRRAGQPNPRLDTGVGDLARRGDVDDRVQLRVAGETERAVAGEVELTALELVRAAHGIDGPGECHGTARDLAHVEIAAERDVDVAERARGRPARPQLPAAHDEVVGNPHVQVELDVVERTRRRRRRRGGFRRRGRCRLDAPWPARASACRVASSALPAVSAARSADTTSGSASTRYGS